MAVAQQGTSGTADYPLPAQPPDRDSDGVADSADACPSVAGNLKNGCPGELNAVVVGRWRVNALLTQLISLHVTAPTGSRIEVRCSTNGRGCDFRKRIVTRTVKRTTSFTSNFKGRRILPANVTITFRITRPEQLGVYQRLRTRTGRRLPQKTQRCITPAGTVRVCA